MTTDAKVLLAALRRDLAPHVEILRQLANELHAGGPEESGRSAAARGACHALHRALYESAEARTLGDREHEAYLRGLREAEQLLRKRAAEWRVLHGSDRVRWLATDADAAADAIAALIAKADKEIDNG